MSQDTRSITERRRGGPYPSVFDTGSSTQFMLWNVSPGIYYIVASAYNSNSESGYSNEAVATVTGSVPAIAQARFR